MGPLAISPHGNNKAKSKRQFNYAWADLDGLVSSHVFSDHGNPFLRLIAQHSFCAIKKAMKSDNARDINYTTIQEETIKLARLLLTGDGEMEDIMQHSNNLESLLVKVDDDDHDDMKED